MTQRRYLTHLRLGGSTAITTPDSRSAPARFATTAGLKVNNQPVSVGVTLFGPGDVAGVAAAAITRRTPAPGSVGAEVNWFPQLELAEADLPWRFTPVRPGSGGRLRPWCVLVVLEQRPGLAVTSVSGSRLPVVDAPVAELPDLDDADLWAHVEVALPDGTPPASLAAYLREHPQAARSRLLSPRRMAPDTDYLACLVPAFETGRVAGLGADGDAGVGTLAAAWSYAPASPATVRLPVYDSWSFRTGGAADFESLARALRPATPSPEAAERRFALDPALGPGRSLPLRGALRPVGADGAPAPEPVPADVAAAIAERINHAADLSESGGTPVLGSPLYGSMPAGRQRLRQLDTPGWLDAANTDPRNRIAAAAGGDVVQRHQETFVAEAWRQVAQLGAVNQLLRGAQVARGVTARLVARHLQTLPDDLLLQLAGPALARVQATSGSSPTVLETVVTSAVPEAGFEGSFRRITRSRGPQLRRFGSARPVTGSGVMFEQRHRDVSLSGWVAVDQGTVNAPSAWQPVTPTMIRQRSNIHTPVLNPAELPFLGTMFVTGSAGMRDVRFSTIIELRDNDAAGVVFRYRGPTNYYRFSVDPERQRIRLVKCVNGAFTLLMQKDTQVATNEKHRIIVLVEGDRIRVRFGFAFTGQALLADLRDSSHGNGQVGLYAWGNDDVVFSDIELEAQAGLQTSDLPSAVVDQGNVDAPSAWALDEGALVQSRNIYTEPRDRDELSKLGTFVRFGFSFWADYELEATLGMPTDNDAIGLMFRVAGPRHYYRFSIDVERSYRRLVKCVDGRFTLLWQQDIGEDPPLFTRYRIVAAGSRLRGYTTGVRPVKLFEVRDTDLSHGGAAAYCWGTEGARFADMVVRAVSHRGIIGRVNSNGVSGVPIPPNGSLRMAELRADTLTSVDAHHSVRARVLDRAGVPSARTSADPLEQERPAVRFGQPLAPLLAADNPELVLPGLSGVPDNAVVLLTPDAEFVASFLLGANAELARELAWRGLPSDARATAFRQFWDVRDSGEITPDIADIAAWPANRSLAQQVSTGALGSVFLLRSELVRRFPSMAGYLVQAVASGDGRRPGTTVRPPMFGGSLGPDVAYFGFSVPPEEAVGDPQSGWYFVLEQPAGEGRFGLDLTGPPAPAAWSDLAWTHLDSGDRYAHRSSLKVTPPPGPVWSRNAAQMAAITEQQPVRFLVHADRLLAPEGGPE